MWYRVVLLQPKGPQLRSSPLQEPHILLVYLVQFQFKVWGKVLTASVLQLLKTYVAEFAPNLILVTHTTVDFFPGLEMTPVHFI